MMKEETALQQYEKALQEGYPAYLDMVGMERRTTQAIGYVVTIQQVIPEITEGVQGDGHFLINVRKTQA